MTNENKKFHFDHRVPAKDRYEKFVSDILNRGIDDNDKDYGEMVTQKTGADKVPTKLKETEMDLFFKIQARKRAEAKQYTSPAAKKISELSAEVSSL